MAEKEFMPGESLYPEPTTPPSAETAAPPPDEDAGSEPDTALVPKAMLGPDVKVGDTVSLSVVHIYEDEVELGPAGEGTEETSEQQTPDQQLEAMAGPPGA